jgi:hypothetical protein
MQRYIQSNALPCVSISVSGLLPAHLELLRMVNSPLSYVNSLSETAGGEPGVTDNNYGGAGCLGLPGTQYQGE